jgi:flagellar biogenesis protein FliO
VNDSEARRRFLWLTAIGGALVIAIVFISVAAPGAPAGDGPDLRPGASEAAPVAADAVGTASDTPGEDRPGFSLGLGGAASLIWRLALVAIVMVVAIAGLRWWAKKAGAPASTTGFLRVLDTLAISNGRTIHLVALGKRVIVVGATAQQLGFLNELTLEESREVLTQAESDAASSLSGFTAELIQSFTRQAARARGSADIHEIVTSEER